MNVFQEEILKEIEAKYGYKQTMEHLLLDTTAATDLTFNIKDVGYLLGMVVSLLTAWFKMQINHKDSLNKMANMEQKFSEKFEDYKADKVAAKSGRIAVKKELIQFINDKDLIIHKRVDNTQEEIKKIVTKNEVEFKEINQSFADVKTDISEMKGMLKTLLSKES